MDATLVLLGLGALIAMGVGLAKPELVIRWGEKKTRARVVMIYGGLFIAFFIALGLTGDPKTEKNEGKAIAKAEEAQAKAANEEAGKDANLKYDQAAAKKRLIDWLGNHEFPNVTKLALNPGTASDKLFEIEGKKYHLFGMTGLARAVDLLVDPYTGELFYYDTGVTPQPIDKWYLRYRAEHKTDSSNVINDDFAWVERPSLQNGYIVGKVKNTSNKTFKNASIEFNLSDAAKSRVGSVAGQIRNLKPGDTWNFSVSIYMYQSNVASYDLEKVAGYEW